MTPYQLAADAVIGVLSGRRGFDAWWGDVDEETSNEIMDEIAEAIRKEVQP